MLVEKHKLPPPKKIGPNVRKVFRSDWGDICDRYVSGDSIENLGKAYEATNITIVWSLGKARWRIERAILVLVGDSYAINHRPIEDGFTPWLEEKVRTNTLTQLEWILSKLPDVPVKAPKRRKL
jgi:hypothetical protein